MTKTTLRMAVNVKVNVIVITVNGLQSTVNGRPLDCFP